MAIVRARHSAVYPARFMLLAATNPCPCGYAGEHERCRCREADLARHARRLNGPLLDRIDLTVGVHRAPLGPLTANPGPSSASVREQVLAARERQAARLRSHGVLVNAQMDAAMLRECVSLDRVGERMLTEAHAHGEISARGAHRALRVARTIADLHGSERIGADDISFALALRADAWQSTQRAA